VASEVTLTTLRASVRDRADLTGSGFITDAQLDEYINEEASKLYYLLATAFEDYFYSTSDITLVGGTEAYDLPQTAGSTSKFYKSLKVYHKDTSGQRHELRRFSMDALDDEDYWWGPLVANNRHMLYRIMGDKIIFTPKPSSSGTVELWYIEEHQKLVNASDKLSDKFTVVSGWEQYIVYGAAATCLIKEESLEQANALMGKQGKLEQDYRLMAAERDVSEPHRIKDVYVYADAHRNMYGRRL
jgi:hypothetical protein